MMAAQRNSFAPYLGDLLEVSPVGVSVPDIAISGVAMDSREVMPGNLFFALAGRCQHGLDFFDAVVKAGARVILIDQYDARFSPELRSRANATGVTVLPVPELGEQVGSIAARYYGHPSRKMTVVGVTGTDGKTSVSQFVAQALHRKNKPCGVIGTLGSGVPGESIDTGLTTPDAVSLQRTLADFRDRKIAQLAMEVSSHALSQGRVNGVEFDVAVLTNLGRDHLDYHGTVENYHAAKLQLLGCDSVRSTVVNIDDENIRRFFESFCVHPITRYATDPALREKADVFGDDIALGENGIELTIVTAKNRLPVRTQLIGRFNIDNLLAAFSTLRTLGLDERDIAIRLSSLRAVPGRAECFSAINRATAVVDYSHTPQALEAILRSIREHCAGALWCVFGCGGDRDSGKRPLMAAVAERLADHIIVTDDNPRSENGDLIVDDILVGFENPDSILVERNREIAIRQAMERAVDGDWVVIAGKGHEDYQLIGDRRIDLSDREIVAAVLQGRADD
jgi:UDP-N-acetylmuramoyl-L-alanyl-D-glutamate--2,6-diaminopimelate ligase